MKESDEKLKKIALEKKYLNNIAKELKKSPKIAHKRLMKLNQEGITFNQNYFDNGEILYKLKNRYQKESNHTTRLSLMTNTSELKLVVKSDMHIGHKISDLKLMEAVYDYCISNDIHVIFDCGDLIDGACGDKQNKTIIDTQEQIEKVINDYPFNNKILNFITFGNHEISSLEENGIDIAKKLKANRPDLIPVGYGLGIVNILNDQIFMRHSINNQLISKIQNHVILRGHTHQFGYKFRYDELIVTVPSLSRLSYDGPHQPRFLELNLLFNNEGLIDKIHLKNLNVEANKIKKSADIEMDLNFPKAPIREENLKIKYNQNYFKRAKKCK